MNEPKPTLSPGCPYCGNRRTRRGDEYCVDVFVCGTRTNADGEFVQSTVCGLRKLLLECERRIDVLFADSRMDEQKRNTLIRENRRFILRLQSIPRDEG